MATCQREAPAAHRKVSMDSTVTAGSRRRCNALRLLLAPPSVDRILPSPECAPALNHASSSTPTLLRHHTSTASRASIEWVDTDLTHPLDLKALRTLVMVAPLCLTTAASHPLITPTIDWLVRKVHLSSPRLSGPLCSTQVQCRVTRPQQQRTKWCRRAQSGRTGRGTGGRSGSCCPRTMPTHCRKRWCDLRPWTPGDSALLANQWHDQTPMTITPYPFLHFIFYLSLPFIHSSMDFILSSVLFLHPSAMALLFTCAAAALYELVHPRATSIVKNGCYFCS